MRAAPPPRRLVFSDVDETLIRQKSMFGFLDYYFARRDGPAGERHATAVRRDLEDLVGAGAPRELANRRYYRAWAGQHSDEVHRWGRRWYAEQAASPDFFVTATVAALTRHRARGEPILLVSGSFPAVLAPLAEAVGASGLVCTRQEVSGGRFTGEILGDPVIGEGKRAAVRDVLARYPSVDPRECFGYGDHVSDLPMLEQVGNPVVVGGDPELLRRLTGARTMRR
ncbi:HAD family hydrolase [Actinoplanes cyaneus]|uniref:HAD family hydrolase n=1 Tax=Actinoplanes cyaneus TaxID=52696 RepID=UPI001EF34748|nr:HAD family hydrolase [Actinoplanes cyaneus]MCW2137819.1 HAD-superfamily subfamily IB hydrolase, TIGR01490 [Actinoplanes cyaneus]